MPWYNQGTVDVTANSDTVTGTGTAFSANVRVGDAFIGPDLGLYEVTNIASATVLSIRPNYQGATASGQAYAIAPMQGYVKESADRLRQLVDQFGAQLAALQPWATAPTPAQAREAMGAAVVGDALFTAETQAEGRTALGLGTAATRAAQTGATDTTAGALMAVGAFGLGTSVAGGTQAADAARNVSGFFSAFDPIASEYPEEEVLLVALQHTNPDYAARLAVSLTGTPYVRSKIGGTWHPAQKIFHTGNILGAVSQSAGIPTGAVFQFTETASGQTWRNAAGLQICTNSNNPITTDPAAFVGTPTSLDGNKMKIGRWF